MIIITYPWVLIGLLLIIACIALRWLYYEPYAYFYPAIGLKIQQHINTLPLLFMLRGLALAALLLAIARPRKELGREYSHVPGIDIQLLIDVSGSMDLYDDLKDKRSRLTVAKEEALKFIQKRPTDSIGLIIFAACAVSKCPVTFDKALLSEFVKDLSIGTINPEGTLLSGSLLLAAKKLSTTKGASRVIIMLTDGAPSPHDIDPEEVIPFLQKNNIKVYTIGIGSEEGGYFNHPLYGVVSMPTPVNKELLSHIAQQTNGVFFQAKNAHDLERIYQEIDRLEKSDQNVPHIVLYKEYFPYLLWLAFFVLLIEILYGLAKKWLW